MFFQEFLRDWIADNMEDPRERDVKTYIAVLESKRSAENL